MWTILDLVNLVYGFVLFIKEWWRRKKYYGNQGHQKLDGHRCTILNLWQFCILKICFYIQIFEYSLDLKNPFLETYEGNILHYRSWHALIYLVLAHMNLSMEVHINKGPGGLTSAPAEAPGESSLRFFRGPMAARAVRLASRCLIWASSCCCIWMARTYNQY